MTIKFMNTKERCLQCGEKLQAIEITNIKDQHFCSNDCKDTWENQ
jgi:transposase-like protein